MGHSASKEGEKVTVGFEESWYVHKSHHPKPSAIFLTPQSIENNVDRKNKTSDWLCS